MIKYAHCAALINMGTYDDIVKAIQMLLDMEIYEFSIPAIYILLARAYCKLNRYIVKWVHIYIFILIIKLPIVVLYYTSPQRI